MSNQNTELAPATAQDADQLLSSLERFVVGEMTLAEVLEIDGDQVYAMVAEGDHFFDSGRFAEAITVFEGCLALNPIDPLLACRLGVARHRAGDPEWAELCFTHAREVAEDPALVDAALAEYGLSKT